MNLIMEISELTIGELTKLAKLFGSKNQEELVDLRFRTCSK